MRQKKFWFLAIILISMVFLQGCGRKFSKWEGNVYRIGIDPSWYPLNFGKLQSNVNAFVEEVLFEIAKETGVEFEKVRANWDTFFDGLETTKNKESLYDAVISSMTPRNYNEGYYCFSDLFLFTGPTLVFPIQSKATSLEGMKKKRIGVIQGEHSSIILQKYPSILIQYYHSVPEALNDITEGQIEGALINFFIAKSYVHNLYYQQLKMTAPLTEEGLRFVAKKEKQDELMEILQEGLQILKNNNKLEEIKQKWLLSY